MTYSPLGQSTLPELERELLATWEREGLFHQTLRATRDGEPFVFFEGPPTANGRPGIHHVFARTIKDLVCRYHTMCGRRVTRIAGWDTHGLPVEIEVEKALGLSGKADIERFGVAEFNRRCRESVFRYKNDWELLSSRIGYWLDYDRPYVTYTNEYIESVWWSLKRLHDRGLLYEGHKVLPYCPRCGTSLSSHELAMGYAAHKSPSIYVLFRLAEPTGDGRARHLLVWTTTPWTLPSNIAVAVHPDLRYLELDIDGRLVIVEETIARGRTVPGGTHGKPLAEFPCVGAFTGRDLVGRRYEQLLDVVEVDPGRAFRIVVGEFVTGDEGTGLVHLAPAFGADDFATIEREGLAFVNPVDAAGRFTGTRWDEINGKTVFEANPVIAARLDAEGKLFGRYEPAGYEHSYPFCWRCDSPLIYYARSSWFVRTTRYKDRMVECNRAIGWQPPEVGERRFGEWLENNVDWALSRDRFWGTPLPIWRCEDCVELAVVGSYEELASLRGEALPDGFDPHKPFIDEIVLSCSACGGTMRRVSEVIDAWYDSGAMPFAQWHYPFENRAEFGRHFPADFICEGLDQTRGWFYSLLAIAVGAFDETAYRNVVVNGLVLDADGRKMSKRVGNVVDPSDAVERFGADTVRLYLLASSQVWHEKRFDPDAIPEAVGGSLNRLRNTYGFFALYAEDFRLADAPAIDERALVDRWLLDRLHGVVAKVRGSWDGYDVTTGVRALLDFCDNDLSNWYVRVNRGRFWAPGGSAEPAALATLYEALVCVTRLLAPAAPFLSDMIHRRLTGESVHLARMPEPAPEREPGLARAMDAVRRLATLARAAREAVGIRVRQPLARMRVAVPAAALGEAFDALLGLLATEVNVKQVTAVASDEELVRLKGKPNFRTLGKVYGKDTPKAAAAVANLDRGALSALESGKEVTLETGGREFRYRPEDVTVQREVVTDWLVQSDGPFVVALDPTVSDTLRREGLAREVVNRVQRLRKEAGYEYTTRINLHISGDRDVLAASGAFEAFIAGETLARRFETGNDLEKPDVREAVDIDGRRVVITLQRHDETSRSS